MVPVSGHAQQAYDEQLASYQECAQVTHDAYPAEGEWPTKAEADAAIAVCEKTLAFMEETLARPDLTPALLAYSRYWAGDTHRQLGFLMGARQMGTTGTVVAEPAMCEHAEKALSYADGLEAMKFAEEDAQKVIEDLVGQIRKKANIVAGYCD
nr:hypothetical protein GCM10011355_21880 [Aquisalinus luteolus]